MAVLASSFLTLESDSFDAGRAAADALLAAFGSEEIGVVLLYSTINHDQPVLLESLRAALGPKVALVGCSVQGIAGGEDVMENAFALGVMGFGGDALRCATGVARDIAVGSRDKGRQLARGLAGDLAGEPALVVVLYDPLCGADVEALAEGMYAELHCPILGGGASQPWGPAIQTYQYRGDEVLSHGAVALALAGPLAVELGLCHGTVATGMAATVTRTDGVRLLEIDGRPALDWWRDAVGPEQSTPIRQDEAALWSLAVERTYAAPGAGGPTTEVMHMIRGVFGFDADRSALVVQASIPEGSRVEMRRRSIEDMFAGTEVMGNHLARRLGGRRPLAVLGFECAARTSVFLGEAATVSQHRKLCAAVAPDTPWLGMLAWGEVAPLGAEPAFHNLTYPLVVLVATDH